MNSSDLKSKLAAQKKWRESKASDQPVKRRKPGLLIFSAISVAVSTLIVLAIVYAAYLLAPKETTTALSPMAEVPHATAYIPTRVSSPTPVVMKVCIQNLHVRYTPDGSVRGYLKEGEPVTLKLDQQGLPIAKKQNHETWILLASPIEGWANEKYLCK